MNEQAWISGVNNIANYLGLNIRTAELYVQNRVIPTYKMSGSKKVFSKIEELDQLMVKQ